MLEIHCGVALNRVRRKTAHAEGNGQSHRDHVDGEAENQILRSKLPRRDGDGKS